MKTICLFLLSATLITIYSCKASHQKTGNVQVPVQNLTIDQSLVKVFDTSHKIDTTYIVKDVITISLTFYNTCQSDTFELVTNGKFTKSNPPMTAVYLKRKSTNSKCVETIHKELKFDLSKLRYPLANSIILNLDEQVKVLYSY